jgi:hypothetical protein
MRPMDWLGVLAVVLLAHSAAGQESYDPYEQIYGPAVDVPLAELAQGVVPYQGQPVRTRGTVELSLDITTQERRFLLRDAGYSILLVARPEVENSWSFEATSNLGRRMQFTGLYSATTDSADFFTGGPSGVLEFWKYGQAPDEEIDRRAKARTVTIEALVGSAERYAGALVRVTGEFRGNNLYGDLPLSSRRWPKDWVLREGFNAVWVTGKPPQGDGFRLDPSLRRDTGKWLSVVGRVETWKGAVYLRARSVALGTAPSEPPAPVPAATPVGPPEPPQIVFSLPLDGEADVPVQTRFSIQFSKDMDESSFAGHLLLRYVNREGAVEAGAPQLNAAYDAGRRALTLDPNDVLRVGRRVELVLLAGIKDVDGLALVPRSGKSFADGVDILRFSTSY